MVTEFGGRRREVKKACKAKKPRIRAAEKGRGKWGRTEGTRLKRTPIRPASSSAAGLLQEDSMIGVRAVLARR